MFAGWVTPRERRSHPQPADPQTILASLTRFHSPDRAGVREMPGFTGVQALTWNTPESRHERAPSVCPSSGNVLLSWLRLDNRDDLVRGLDIPHPGRVTDPELVLAAYLRWDVDCAARLEGDFSFALWDKQRSSLYLARDSIGVKPLFYTEANSFFGFATTAATFQAFPGVDSTPDPLWLARYLTGTSMSFTGTAFRQVKKLAPGHWMLVDGSGAVSTRRYHQFVDDAPWSDVRDPHWVRQYRSVLESAVAARTRSSYPLGVEVTGGLDSSAVLGVILDLDPKQGESLQTFGKVDTDLEPEFILETSRMHNVRRNNIWTGWGWYVDPMSAHRRGWEALGYPIEHLSATAYLPFYETAHAAGIRTLQSGFGGDEVVTNPAKQLTIELLQRRRWLLALKELPGGRAVRPARLAKRAWRLRRSSDPHPGLLETMLAELEGSVVRDELLREAGVRQRVLSDAGYGSRHRSINDYILNYRLVPFVPTRTEQCTILAATYGAEYRWALLDRRLMQQYLSTPAIEKWGEGFGRYLHRRAVADVVPEKVVWRRSKQLGSPTVPFRARKSNYFSSPLPWADLDPALQEIVDPDKWRVCMAAPPWDGTGDSRAWAIAGLRHSVRGVNEWLHDR